MNDGGLQHGGNRRAIGMAALFATTMMVGIAPVVPAQAQRASTRSFDIPAQPLPAALAIFGRQSGMQVSVAADLAKDHVSSRVTGKLVIHEALSRLLVGTGLVYRISGNIVTLEPAPQTAAGTIQLGPVRVEGEGSSGALAQRTAAGEETATSPVLGYAARVTSSGVKGEAAVVEVPQSISIVTSGQIATLKPQSLDDALAYTSSVGISEGFGRSGQVFVIRGFATSPQAGGVLRDGMRIYGAFYDGQQEPFGLERIEVVKGAASILYGAAAPGGVVNSISKRPTDSPFGEVGVDIGNFNRKQLTFDVSDRVSPALTWRMTVLARDSKAFLDNFDDDRLYIAPALEWVPASGTSITLLGNYQYTNSDYYYALPLEGTVAPNRNGQIARKRNIGDPRADRYIEKSYSVGYLADHEVFPGLKLHSAMRFFKSVQRNDNANDGGFLESSSRVIARDLYSQPGSSSSYTFDNNISYALQHSRFLNNIVAGIDLSYQKSDVDGFTASLSELDLFAPTSVSPVGVRSPILYDYDARYRRIGVYVEDRVKFDDKWVLILGLRQEWFKTGQRAGSSAASPLSFEHDKALTGRAGLVYLADNGLAPYVSVSQSFQPQLGRNRSGDRFDPTKGLQYEAGLRYQPAGSDLLLTAAVYQLTKTNVLTPDPIEPLRYSVQTGAVRARGIELEAKGDVTPRLAVIGAYAFTDAKVTRSNDPAKVGKPNPNTARHQASLWIEYRLSSDGTGLMLGSGARYAGSAPATYLAASRPAYTVLDARVGYGLDRWHLSINASNLLDKTYVASCTYGCFYGEARRIIGSLAYRW